LTFPHFGQVLGSGVLVGLLLFVTILSKQFPLAVCFYLLRPFTNLLVVKLSVARKIFLSDAAKGLSLLSPVTEDVNVSNRFV